MASRADIERALEELPGGSEVTVVLKDGREVNGTLRGTETDSIELDRADSEDVDLDLDGVDTILVSDSTEGPE